MLKMGPDSEPKTTDTENILRVIKGGEGGGIRRLVLTYILPYIDNQQGATA